VRSGTTFVEVAIASLFLALAMVPLLDSVVTGSRRARQDRSRTFATSLASSAIERYRLETPAGCIATAAGADSDPVLNPADADPLWKQVRSQFVVDCSCTDDGGVATLKAEVRWQEGGVDRSLELTTLVVPTFAMGAP
jgi:type II secretory pathway pseudopilin PulG